MRKLFLAALLVFIPLIAIAQTPPPVGAFKYSAGSWIAAATSATGGAISNIPPPVALYCYNSSTFQWVPADSSCFGGSSSGTVNAGTIGQLAYYAANGAAVSGAVLSVFIPPSGDTTGVADNAAIQAAITAGNKVLLGKGNYYITGLTWSAPSDLVCDNSGGTFIYRTTTTTDFFNIHYGGGETNNESTGMTIRGCNLLMKGGVTPTAGYAFNLSGVDVTHSLSGVHIENNSMYGLWGGAFFQSLQINNWYTNNFFDTGVSSTGSCINVNVDPAVGGGDDNFDGDQCTGPNAFAPVVIQKCDTMEFSGLKLTGSNVKFTGSGTCNRIRFINSGIEYGTLSCAIDLGVGTQPTNPQFMNLEVQGAANPATIFCGNVRPTATGVHYSVMNNVTSDPNYGWNEGPSTNIVAYDSTQAGSASVAVTDQSATPVGGQLAVYGQTFSVASARGFAALTTTTAATNGILIFASQVASGGTGVINMNPGGYDTGGNTAVFSGAATTFKVPLLAAGTTSVSGCSLTSAVGGTWAGSFHSGTTGTCTVTITPGNTATNGFSCWMNDLTTVADVLHQTSASNATTAVISGTTASGDVINWGCIAY